MTDTESNAKGLLSRVARLTICFFSIERAVILTKIEGETRKKTYVLRGDKKKKRQEEGKITIL